MYESNKQSHPSPIAACCKELHQVEDLTSQPGTIGTKLASRALYDSIPVFISLWIPLSICIFKCVHFKGQFGWRGGKVDGWKTHLFGWREKGKDEKCNLYKLTIIHLLHNM